MKDLALLTWY